MMRYFLLTIFLFVFSGCSTTSEIPSGSSNVIPNSKISSSKAEEPKIEDNRLNIGLLVPTNNKKDSNYASLVNSTQMAMMDANNANINIIPINSEMINNDPQKLLAQLEEDRVKLILGPVYAQETESLVSLLKGKDITILSLSNDSSLKDESLLILGITPNLQADILTRYAISQGISKFHMFLPSSKYGKLIDEAVSDLVSQKENGFYTVSWYSGENFDQALEEFISKIPGQAEDKTVIFMPQGGKNLVALSKTLDHYGVNFRLMGSQAWHYDNLLALKNFDKAILLKHQILDPNFIHEYHKLYRKKASNIDWIAYNALLMIAKMDKDNQLLNKQNIILRNQHSDSYSKIRFNHNGIAIYDIPVVEVHDGKFKTMENPQ